MNNRKIEVNIKNKIAEIVFYHFKSNAFSIKQLQKLSNVFDSLGNNKKINVIILRSFRGEIFSSGAYFDELLQISNIRTGEFFFKHFAKLIITMIRCPKPIIGCISGKVIGGGVGLVAACDYVIAESNVLVRLSELSIGIGSFIIEPVLRHRIGTSHFMSLALNPIRWYIADWCKTVGLISEIVTESNKLKNRVWDFSQELSSYSSKAIYEMKKIFWNNTDNWEELLNERVSINAKLILSYESKTALNKFKKK